MSQYRLMNLCNIIKIPRNLNHNCVLCLHTISFQFFNEHFVICYRLWFTGLCWLIRAINRQRKLSDRRLLWLREQYMQLYHEDGYCCGPLAADAIRVS